MDGDDCFRAWKFFHRVRSPISQGDAVAEAGEEFALIAQGEHSGRERGGTVVAEERRRGGRGALVGEQAEDDTPPIHRRAQQGAVGATFEKQAAGAFAKILHQPVESRLFQCPISRGTLITCRRLI